MGRVDPVRTASSRVSEEQAWIANLEAARKPVYSTTMYVLDSRQKDRNAILEAIDTAQRNAELKLAGLLEAEAKARADALRSKHDTGEED